MAIVISSPPSFAAVKIMFLVILGRTDLRISLSRAKFDAEADFDVRSAVEPQKPHQISEKRIFRSDLFAEKIFWRQKMKRRESSETRFGKVWRACELRSRRKRRFKVLQTAVAVIISTLTRR